MITEYTTVEQENRHAKQEMNNMYLKMVGDSERLKVLKFLNNHVWLFRIGSVLASMFGFYYDLVLGFGILGAIALAMLISYIIEAIKIYGTKASFAYMGSWVGYGAIVLTALVMYTAYLFHYKSLTNYKNMMDKEDSSLVYAHKVNQDNAFNKVNLELVGVLKNGTSKDDAVASSSIQSTNKLLANNGNDYATKAFLDASSITNTGLATTLFLIFIFLESCSLFGVIAGMILMASTDKNVKSIVKTQDKLNQMETNVYQAVETQMIGNSMTRIEDNMKQVENHPTPMITGQNNEQKQPNKPQFPFYNINGLNSYFMGSIPNVGTNSEHSNNLPIVSTIKPEFSGCYTEGSTSKKEEDGKLTKKAHLDLLKYSAKEQEIIKVMWENSEVKAGDRLLQKRLVKKELKEDKYITIRDIDNCYEKLMDNQMIEHRGGYRALVDIENVVTEKVG